MAEVAASQDSREKAVSGGVLTLLKGAVIGLALTAVGIIAALLLFEIGYRLMTRSAGAPSWSDRPRSYYKAPAAANLQDYAYNPVKPAGVYRIAVLGDSFTFATRMQFDDAFPKKLERMLSLNTAQKKVEVINYGVPGFSTSHEADLLPRVIEEGADLVLLQITLNDPQVKPYTPQGITGKNEFGALQLDGSKAWLARHWKSFGFVLTRLHNTGTLDRYKKYYFSLFNSRTAWNSFDGGLKQMARQARRRGVRLAAVTFPLFGTPLDDSYPFLPLHEKIGHALDALAIPHLDLFPLYRGIPLSRLQVIPGDDFHPNEIGHRMAAEAIFDWLAKDRLIPEELTSVEQYRERLDIRPEKNGRILEG